MPANDVAATARSEVLRGAWDSLPLPRRGVTGARWEQLRAWGRGDLALAKLAESHTDAVSVLADAGREAEPGLLRAVWASASGGTGLKATRRAGGGLRVEGRIRYASAVRFVDRALVTARSEEGLHLVELELPDPRVVPVDGTWPAVGMAGTESLDVDVAALDLPASAEVGEPGWYLARPGFWVNGIGVAAVWCGGAAAIVDDVTALLAMRPPSGHQLAHLGAAVAALAAADSTVRAAAVAVDADPDGDHAARARMVRHVVEQSVGEIVERAGRAVGPEPLVHDAVHAQRVADLQVFVRQVGSENDLEALGAAVLADPSCWTR